MNVRQLNKKYLIAALTLILMLVFTGSATAAFESTIDITEPDDGVTFEYSYGDNNYPVSFEADISAFDDLDLSLILNGQTIDTDSVPGASSYTYSYDESLSEGTYDWYIELENTQGDTYTTETRSFDVNEQTPLAPGLDYFEPSDGSTFEIDSGSTYNVNHEWLVESGDESGTARLYIDGVEVYSENFAGYSSTTMNYNEDQTEGSYDWEITLETDYYGEVTYESGTYTVEEDVLPPTDITLNDPNDGESFEYSANQDNEDIEFSTTVTAGDESGTANLYIDGNQVSSDSFSGLSTTTIEHTEALSSGNYDWYVETVTDTYTNTSNTQSFSVSQSDAISPSFFSMEPEDNEDFSYLINEDNVSVDFQFGVEAGDEDGNVTLYVDDSPVFEDSYSDLTSTTFSHTEYLTNGTYDWYVEANTDSLNVDSDVRTFNVSQDPASEPTIDLIQPENNTDIGGNDSANVPFEVKVSSNLDANVTIELFKPGENSSEIIESFDYPSYTTRFYNFNHTIENITYPDVIDNANTSENYRWKVGFNSTSTSDYFESNESIFRFVEEEETDTEKTVTGIMDFIGKFWGAFNDNTGPTAKAFVGLVLMLVFGGLGYSIAGSTGGEVSMLFIVIVNSLAGLFPGWIALALVILAVAYILIMND